MCVLPLEIENPVITVQLEIELVKAYAIDLKELDYYKVLPNGEKEGKFKLRENLPFFLVNSVGTIEPKIHFLNSDWHPKEITKYLNNGQIYIHKQTVIG